jgi:hypothetical protein
MIDITDWPPPPPKAANGFLRILVGKAAAQVQLQHGVGGNRGGAGGAGRHDDQKEGDADQEQHQADENAGHGHEKLLHRTSCCLLSRKLVATLASRSNEQRATRRRPHAVAARVPEGRRGAAPCRYFQEFSGKNGRSGRI